MTVALSASAGKPYLPLWYTGVTAYTLMPINPYLPGEYGFYEKFGFVKMGKPFMIGPDGSLEGVCRFICGMNTKLIHVTPNVTVCADASAGIVGQQ